MEQLLSACGLLCDKCDYYNNTCQGCLAVKGITFWSKKLIPDMLCPLYKCAVIDERLTTCGKCSELPCQKHEELKGPNISEEAHKKSINERVMRLSESINPE